MLEITGTGSFVDLTSDDKSLTPQQKRDITDVMEKIRANKGVTIEDIHKLRQQKLDILEELEKEFNSDIARVGKTFSGIELVHFLRPCGSKRHPSGCRALVSY